MTSSGHKKVIQNHQEPKKFRNFFIFINLVTTRSAEGSWTVRSTLCPFHWRVFLLAVHIWCRAVIQLSIFRSQQSINCTCRHWAQLPCHVQNFVVTTLHESRRNENETSTLFDYDGNQLVKRALHRDPDQSHWGWSWAQAPLTPSNWSALYRGRGSPVMSCIFLKANNAQQSSGGCAGFNVRLKSYLVLISNFISTNE